MQLDKQAVKDGEEQDHKEACSEKCLQNVAREVDWPRVEVVSRERTLTEAISKDTEEVVSIRIHGSQRNRLYFDESTLLFVLL